MIPVALKEVVFRRTRSTSWEGLESGERKLFGCEGFSLSQVANCVRVGGTGWRAGQTAPGFISLLFVCQSISRPYYANDFLWRKSFIAFSIPVLEDVTSGKKLVIILEKCSALSLLFAKHLKPATRRAGIF